MAWKPLYEMEGISIGVRTFRRPKDKLVEADTHASVEMLVKAKTMFLNGFCPASS
jgi:hypothetical protein|eukprot:COSAG01_NODE_10683_length_2105_cov_2.314556_1_plen_55_part_00